MPDEKDKPRLDEQTFGRLLEAAYVLQEHSRELRKLERHLESRRVAEDNGAAKSDAPESSALETGGAGAARSHATGRLAVASQQHFSTPVHSGQSVQGEEHFSLDSLPSRSASLPSLEEAREFPANGRGPASSSPAANYTVTLGQIVQTQHQIRARHLELENSMSLVAERVTEIAKAGGAAIGFFDAAKNKVRYRGVAGSMTLPMGTEVSFEKALCAACLRTGQVIRCTDVNPEFLFDPEECRRRGIQALIAVPIFHEGGIAGALELYYATTQAFTEQDVHTCQLMAGLITEALAREREDDLDWKNSLAGERAVMLEALERLKPNLAALEVTPSAKGAAAGSASSETLGAAAVPAAPTFECRNCGHRLMGKEQFCGKCGVRRGESDRTPVRNADYAPPSMQSKLASLWEVQDAIKNSAVALPANVGPEPVTPHYASPHQAPLDHMPRSLSDPALPEKPLADSIEEEMPELFAAPELRSRNMPLSEPLHAAEYGPPLPADPQKLILSPDLELQEDELREDEPGTRDKETESEPQSATALMGPLPANWSSALTAREFLEQLALVNQPGTLARFWRARRGDIYLAIAVLLVAAVVRWGIWSSHSVSATGKPAPVAAGRRNPAPDADLSVFDRMLISLGLADPPPAPEYKGNPETQVWVDLHTALYYCPGADLYGKTPKGKFTSQRDAQLDSFEPAYRKACD